MCRWCVFGGGVTGWAGTPGGSLVERIALFEVMRHTQHGAHHERAVLRRARVCDHGLDLGLRGSVDLRADFSPFRPIEVKVLLLTALECQ